MLNNNVKNCKLKLIGNVLPMKEIQPLPQLPQLLPHTTSTTNNNCTTKITKMIRTPPQNNWFLFIFCRIPSTTFRGLCECLNRCDISWWCKACSRRDYMTEQDLEALPICSAATSFVLPVSIYFQGRKHMCSSIIVTQPFNSSWVNYFDLHRFHWALYSVMCKQRESFLCSPLVRLDRLKRTSEAL